MNGPGGAVLWCDDVTKFYRRGSERSNMRAALPGRAGRHRSGADIAALRDVTLTLPAGESIGVIGPNGAGKTTLLKAVAGVIAPTSGRLGTRGRLAPIIDLGVGFHPELTGAENLQCVATLMGLRRSELRRKYDDIVAFAGVEEFMQTPVKRFSTGMLARLGFAIASSVDADVLLVDEVMGVGDADFQRRSFDRIRELQHRGTSLVLVSHNLWQVAQTCDRVVRFEHGRMVDDGRARDVIERYSGAEAAVGGSWGRSAARLSQLRLAPAVIDVHQGTDVTATLDVDRAMPSATIEVAVLVAGEDTMWAPRTDAGPAPFAEPGRWEVSVRIPSFPLASGYYDIAMTVLDRGERLSRAVGELHVRGPASGRADLLSGTVWRCDRLPM